VAQQQPVKKDAVTVYDVARRAGVSHQTVSRVANHRPNVSPETRERVLRAIDELGYTPDRAARILSTGRSRIIQIVSIGFSHTQPVMAMIRTARRLGYDTAFAIVEDVSSNADLREQLAGLGPDLLDGLIVIAPTAEIPAQDILDLCADIPVVLAGPDTRANAPAIVIDQAYGVNLALQHLYQLGHRAIAEIPGPAVYYDAQARHQAYLAFMAAHDLEPLTVKGASTWMAEGGYSAVNAFLDEGAVFTALACANDLLALGALRALHERKRVVPDDVSVVGYDDMDTAEYCTPPLTTVKQDFASVGQEAILYLVHLMEESPAAIHRRVLTPELIVRQSTCKAGRLG
jgi:DNA-binding LacI/PurR family transcriptional regulator